jgi:hypothetical protein
MRCQYIKRGFQCSTIFESLTIVVVVAYACMEEIYTKFWSENHKERDQLRDR